MSIMTFINYKRSFLPVVGLRPSWVPGFLFPKSGIPKVENSEDATYSFTTSADCPLIVSQKVLKKYGLRLVLVALRRLQCRARSRSGIGRHQLFKDSNSNFLGFYENNDANGVFVFEGIKPDKFPSGQKEIDRKWHVFSSPSSNVTK